MFLAVPNCLFILREDAKKGAGGNFFCSFLNAPGSITVRQRHVPVVLRPKGVLPALEGGRKVQGFQSLVRND